jgi:hypothetical protein
VLQLSLLTRGDSLENAKKQEQRRIRWKPYRTSKLVVASLNRLLIYGFAVKANDDRSIAKQRLGPACRRQHHAPILIVRNQRVSGDFFCCGRTRGIEAFSQKKIPISSAIIRVVKYSWSRLTWFVDIMDFRFNCFQFFLFVLICFRDSLIALRINKRLPFLLHRD